MEESKEKDLIPIWQEFMKNERRLPREYRKGIYEGIVESVKEAFPETKRLPTSMLMRLMEVESSLDPGKVNPSSGAVGLMQVKPSTHSWMQEKFNFSVGDDLSDPDTNIAAGMMYLNYLQGKFKTINKALHSYNVGPTRFMRGGRARKYTGDILGGGG